MTERIPFRFLRIETLKPYCAEHLIPRLSEPIKSRKAALIVIEANVSQWSLAVKEPDLIRYKFSTLYCLKGNLLGPVHEAASECIGEFHAVESWLNDYGLKTCAECSKETNIKFLPAKKAVFEKDEGAHPPSVVPAFRKISDSDFVPLCSICVSPKMIAGLTGSNIHNWEVDLIDLDTNGVLYPIQDSDTARIDTYSSNYSFHRGTK